MDRWVVVFVPREGSRARAWAGEERALETLEVAVSWLGDEIVSEFGLSILLAAVLEKGKEGKDGIEGSESDIESKKLFFAGCPVGWIDPTQGEKAYFCHSEASKKLTGYSSPVSLLIKQWPSSGSRT